MAMTNRGSPSHMGGLLSRIFYHKASTILLVVCNEHPSKASYTPLRTPLPSMFRSYAAPPIQCANKKVWQNLALDEG